MRHPRDFRARAARAARLTARAIAPWFAVAATMAVIYLTGWTAHYAPVMAVPIIVALAIAAVAPWPPTRRTMVVSSLAVLAIALGCAALAVSA